MLPSIHTTFYKLFQFEKTDHQMEDVIHGIYLSLKFLLIISTTNHQLLLLLLIWTEPVNRF